MALVLKTLKTSESSTELVLTDDTGDYSSENLGGYGDPNPERSTLNLGVTVTRKTSDGNVSLVVTRSSPSSSTVNNVTAWTVTLDGGGYHRIGIFTAPTYDELALYSQYDIVYEPASDKFYYYSNVEDSLAGAFAIVNGWLELTDTDILEKTTQTVEDDGVNKTITNDFLTYGAKACFAVKSEDYFSAESCSKCLDAEIKENFRILTYRILAEATAAIGNYVKAQIILEKIEELCDSSTSSSCSC